MLDERVVVTGATGFIGRALTKALLAEGAKVTALVREHPGRPLSKGIPEGADALEADLRYAAGLKRAIELVNPTLVVHLAAVGVTEPFISEHDALRGNVEGTINLLNAVNGCCRVIVARTPGEIESINTYAASKAAAWQFCRMYHRTRDWPITAVMPFQVYGPGQSLKTALGAAVSAARSGDSFPTTSGEQVRDWIYVDDVVGGIMATARSENVDGETVELGVGIGTAVSTVVERVFQLAGRGRPIIGALPQRPGEVPSQIADADRTERLIGWRAKVGLEEGLRKIISN
jgi:nucleoside-diphosphate-sugar epimerase